MRAFEVALSKCSQEERADMKHHMLCAFRPVIEKMPEDLQSLAWKQFAGTFD